MSNKVSICGVDTSQLPKLKHAEMMELMKKIRKGDEFARDQFIIANLRLVLSVVQRFRDKKEKSDDMFQIGCVGLIKAMNNFDMSLNVRFSTYAVPMIIGEIRRYLRDNNSVRVSRSLRDIAYKALQARDALTSELNKEPTLDMIAEKIELPVKSVICALDAISDSVSLSDPIYSDGGESINVIDHISDVKNDASKMIENFALKNSLTKLDPREKEILLMRYYIGKTQMEVSQEVGISQAQVSRLEKNALKYIRSDLSF